MYKFIYIIAMYTGLRAGLNLLRCCFLPQSGAYILDGKSLDLDGKLLIRIRVHCRANRREASSDSVFGIVSVFLPSSGVSRFRYWLIRLTSHFGCGHLEFAFVEKDDLITFYASRNIVRSNIERFACEHLLPGLEKLDERHEIRVLRRLMTELAQRGKRVAFASPDQCVLLAVDDFLISPHRRNSVKQALLRKYRKLFRKCGTAAT